MVTPHDTAPADITPDPAGSGDAVDSGHVAAPDAAPDYVAMTSAQENFTGEPDGFGRLWTPHRMAYIEGERPSKTAGDGCPFCAAPGKDDSEGLIVRRGELCFVVMNLFPYNPGHLLVCPYRHVPHYIDLTDEETLEFTTLTKQGIHALQAASGPAGFNLGMNQGAVAGAGVAAHLHQHIVPRWAGDMNFMPIVGRTKALPVLLEDSRQRIAAAWPSE